MPSACFVDFRIAPDLSGLKSVSSSPLAMGTLIPHTIHSNLLQLKQTVAKPDGLLFDLALAVCCLPKRGHLPAGPEHVRRPTLIQNFAVAVSACIPAAARGRSCHARSQLPGFRILGLSGGLTSHRSASCNAKGLCAKGFFSGCVPFRKLLVRRAPKSRARTCRRMGTSQA